MEDGWQVKRAGEKGWSEFQSLWTDPKEEGGEVTTAEGEMGMEERERGGEEGVGDLLGSFSDEPAHSGSTQPTRQAPGSRTGSKSYGTTSYGTTDRGTASRGECERIFLSLSVNTPVVYPEPAETNSPSWDDPSWGPGGVWGDDSGGGGGRGEGGRSQKPTKSGSGTKTRESDGGWGDSWGWETADFRTAKND